MRKLIVLLVLGILLVPSIAWACGGFFSPDDPMNQSAERMIFTVNGDGTITAIVGIDYQGEASEFSWLLPVPSVPEIEVAERATLDELQEATNVEFTRPKNYCNALHPGGDGFGGGGGELEMGTVGPYDYVILGGEDFPDVVGWLRDNGYQVDEKAEPIINEYVEMGMYFVGMKLRADAAIGDIQPVQLTFEAEQPMIPIKLASVAATEVVPIYVWIFGNTQYAPQNYEAVLADYSDQRGFGVFGYIDPPDRPLIQYAEERREIMDEYDGHAFITEYAQPTSELPELADPLLADLAGRFPYVTRLWAELTPAQMTLDPMFAPAPDAPNVSNMVNIEEHVEPLMYWGCTAKAALTDFYLENLPTGRTRIDDFQLTLAHPEGWVVSNFEFNNQPVWAVAPEPVTAETFLNGDIPVLFTTEVYAGLPIDALKTKFCDVAIRWVGFCCSSRYSSVSSQRVLTPYGRSP